jgi:protein-S-isoprenylcysteine O-methyltransferase Ste14
MPGLSLAATRAGLASVVTNVGVATLFLAFAYAHALAFARQPRASLVLLVAFEGLFAIFFITRRGASATSSSPVDWVSTVAGTMLPLLLRPTSGPDALGGQIVQSVGSALGVAGILSLSRSVGLLPANRGVRSAGAYAIVRHPLYASYMLSEAGYVWSHPTPLNIAVALAVLAAQLVRIQREERLLARDPGYRAYQLRTRWRLLPFVY